MLRFATISLLLVCFALEATASWQQVHRFKNQATCAYFFDEYTGLVGFGSAMSTVSVCDIELTTDGGQTWRAAAIPSTKGRLSSIFMRTNLVGYASMMYGDYSLWKTTDGGLSWTVLPQTAGDDGTCVYATSAALIRTSWSVVGGSSTNDGASFSSVFRSQDKKQLSNGIGFFDDMTGVVTMGPDYEFFVGATAYTYFTTNGGVSWSRGGKMREAWSVYAEPISRSYYAIAEDEQSSPGNILYRSDDVTRTWTPLFTFKNLEFTGHIAGGGGAMYVQTSSKSNQGLLRSDDNGVSWHKVGGPSNSRDTRFVVLGCKGQIVYAFDNGGGIWKTDNGGDGTLTPIPHLGDIPSGRPGTEILIPIVYDSLDVPTPIQGLSGTFSLNDNLLGPDSLLFGRSQLADKVASDTLYSTSPGQWVYDIKFKPNTVLTGSASLPLLVIRAKAYLTDTNVTDVLLGSILLSNGGTSTPMSPCSNELSALAAKFRLQMDCSDTALYQYMRGAQIGLAFSAYPNPANDEVRLSGDLPVTLSLRAVLYTAGGQVIQQEFFDRVSGHLDHPISIRGVPPGIYVLRIETSAGTTHTIKIAVER